MNQRRILYSIVRAQELFNYFLYQKHAIKHAISKHVFLVLVQNNKIISKMVRIALWWKNQEVEKVPYPRKFEQIAI